MIQQCLVEIKQKVMMHSAPPGPVPGKPPAFSQNFPAYHFSLRQTSRHQYIPSMPVKTTALYVLNLSTIPNISFGRMALPAAPKNIHTRAASERKPSVFR